MVNIITLTGLKLSQQTNLRAFLGGNIKIRLASGIPMRKHLSYVNCEEHYHMGWGLGLIKPWSTLSRNTHHTAGWLQRKPHPHFSCHRPPDRMGYMLWKCRAKSTPSPLSFFSDALSWPQEKHWWALPGVPDWRFYASRHLSLIITLPHLASHYLGKQQLNGPSAFIIEEESWQRLGVFSGRTDLQRFPSGYVGTAMWALEVLRRCHSAALETQLEPRASCSLLLIFHLGQNTYP